MMGVVGWSIESLGGLTMAQLVQAYDAKLLYDWDQTSHQLAVMDGIICTLVNIHSKKKMKPKYPSDFHPFRQKKRRGLVIDGTKDGMNVLKSLGDSIFGKVN